MRNRLGSIPLMLAVFFCGSAAFAQEAASFTALSACRIDAETVLLKATFDGGACQEVEPATLAEPRGTIVAVTLASASTAEICTMQIVPIEVEQAIEASEPIFTLDVTALNPDNNVAAHGQVDIDEAAKDCTKPEG